MTALEVIPNPAGLDRFADPAAAVIVSCERAKEWLVHCLGHGDIEQIVELKSRAEAIRVYTTAKQLGRDAELAASEIVRRAERGIGVCIRKGQEEGLVSRAGQRNVGDRNISNLTGMSRPGLATGVYPMTDDVSDEQFEEAISEAKEEGNLSRANVVRKLKPKPAAPVGPDVSTIAGRVRLAKQMASEGATSPQISLAIGVKAIGEFLRRHEITVPADAVMPKRQHRIDPDRVINESIAALEGVAGSLGFVTADVIRSMDAAKRLEWLEALRQPLAAINRFTKELKSS